MGALVPIASVKGYSYYFSRSYRLPDYPTIIIILIDYGIALKEVALTPGPEAVSQFCSFALPAVMGSTSIAMLTQSTILCLLTRCYRNFIQGNPTIY